MRPRMLAGLIVLLAVGAGCSNEASKADGVTVTGNGRAALKYDVLELVLETEFRADTQAKAKAGAERTMNAALAAFRRAGVADGDLVAEGRAGAHAVAGASYTAGTSRYAVRIRDLGKASATLSDALAAAKSADAAAVRWSKVYLKVADATQETTVARKDALAAATRQATELAKASSRRVGEVLSEKDVATAPPPPAGYKTSLLLERDLPGLASFIKASDGRMHVFSKVQVRFELR